MLGGQGTMNVHCLSERNSILNTLLWQPSEDVHAQLNMWVWNLHERDQRLSWEASALRQYLSLVISFDHPWSAGWIKVPLIEGRMLWNINIAKKYQHCKGKDKCIKMNKK